MSPIIIQQPRRILFGTGCLNQAIAELLSHHWRHILVVTSRRASEQHRLLLDSWRALGIVVDVFDGVDREPDLALFGLAQEAARDASPDAVLGLGGGSVLDVAKLVAALYGRTESVQDVFGAGRLKGRTLGLACIPTTAGSGSEVSPNAILLDESERVKKAVVSPFLVPDFAVADPAATASLPASVTAATGMDALIHCIEAYANINAHPVVDAMAIHGIRLLGRSLERAVNEGTDLEARSDAMLGALYGGLCLGPVNTAAVHALAYPLGGEFRIAHGVANSVLLCAVLRHNLPAMTERYAEIAVALGCTREPNSLATAEAGLCRLQAISTSCRLPQRLRDLGLGIQHIPQLAREAMKVTRLLSNNPRAIDQAAAEAIYSSVY